MTRRKEAKKDPRVASEDMLKEVKARAREVALISTMTAGMAESQIVLMVTELRLPVSSAVNLVLATHTLEVPFHGLVELMKQFGMRPERVSHKHGGMRHEHAQGGVAHYHDEDDKELEWKA